MNISLFTDDKLMATVLPYLLNEVHLEVFTRRELTGSNQIDCTHLILGVETIEKKDWERLELAVDLGKITYLMVRNPISFLEEQQARAIGIKDILSDPVTRLIGEESLTIDELFSLLSYHPNQEFRTQTPELLYIGSGAYFHPKQYWIKYEGMQVDLTEKEAALLVFFLENEGRVITKHLLADQLWGGYIQPDGIAKFIARLKNKLGPAKELITSRQLGGFIYIRKK